MRDTATKNKKGSFSTDIISVFTSNVFSLVANLLIVVLISRILGPEAYGLYTAILVIPLLIVSFFQMGIRPSTVFMMGSGKYNQNDIVSGVVSTLIITSGAGILFSSIAYVFLFKSGFTLFLISMALTTIPLRLASIYAGGVFLAKEQLSKANMMNWLTALLMLISALIFVWLLKLKIAGALLGLMISNLVVAIYAIRLLREEYNLSISFSNPLIIKLIKTGVVYALSFFVIQLNYRVDIVLLQWLSTKKELGLYSLGVGVAELLWQIPLAIGLVVMTRSANSTDQKAMNESTARLLRLSLTAGAILSFFIFIISPFVIPLVFGSSYDGSVTIIQTILPGILMIIVFRILSGQLSGMGKPYVALMAFVPALLLNVALNYWLIPQYGGFGAAMSSNGSYLVGNIIYLLIYCKIVGTTPRKVLTFSTDDFKAVRELIKRRLKI